MKKEAIVLTANRNETVDLAFALERMGGDEELLREVIALFVEDLPAQLASIASAVAGRDAGRLIFAAHTLKGAAANLSAEGVVAACHALELIGREDRIDAMNEAWIGLQTEAAHLLERLRPRGRDGLRAKG